MRIMSCDKPLVFFSCYTISVISTVRCSISCKPVSVLMNSEPVKTFVMYKPGCLNNVSIAKIFNSANYCLTER